MQPERARCFAYLRAAASPATLSRSRSDFCNAREGLVWAQFPHLYLNFYTYQYTLGLASANLLADAVLREGEPAAALYRRLIRRGSSVYPLDALSEAGVDLTTPAPVERAFATLEGLLDELEAVVD